MKFDSDFANIGIRHLLAAVTVRDEGSFNRAADKLNVVPSALTETIKQIETFSGVKLFERASRPVMPTQEALPFLQKAEEVLRLFDRSLAELKQLGNIKHGRIAIGASPSLVRHILGDVIRRFTNDYSTIGILIHDDVADRIAAMVISRELDIGLVSQDFTTPELTQRKIAADPFGLVCHAEHPLAFAQHITFDDIDSAQIITLQTETGISRMLLNCPDVPARLKVGKLRAHSTVSQLTLIAHNLGVALLPKHAAHVIQEDKLVFRRIEGFDLIRTIYLIMKSKTNLPPATARFVEYLDFIDPPESA